MKRLAGDNIVDTCREKRCVLRCCRNSMEVGVRLELPFGGVSHFCIWFDAEYFIAIVEKTLGGNTCAATHIGNNGRFGEVRLLPQDFDDAGWVTWAEANV